jgi:peptide-methionine (S)-S-oxide reductase
VAYGPAPVTYDELLRFFLAGHYPTQYVRQGNAVGTEYRSALYWDGEDQHAAALASRERYQAALTAAGRGEITTEIDEAGAAGGAGPFFYAEDHHQQYVHKVPHGYCGLGGTGVSCPIGTGVGAD